VDRFEAMKAFAGVVEEGSFTNAANRLGLSRAAISKVVRQLEDDLGVRLLNRTTRHVNTTEIGAAYYGRCREILAEVVEAEIAASRLQDAPRGILRVNGPMSFGVLHLAPAIAEFMAMYPEIVIDLVLNDRFVDIVEEGFDVVVRISETTGSSMIARKFAESRRVFCAAPSYLEEFGIPEAPADLLRHRCLHYGYTANGSQWRLLAPDGKEHVVRINAPMTVNNGDVLAEAARRGQGIIMMPTFIVGDDLRQGRLKTVLPGYRPPDLVMSALYPPNRHLTAKVRVFIDFLVSRFGPVAYWESDI
jgi:DNA-binding transcriptional LysR family regulator